VTIATGGFLYTGDYVHSWLAATQYIAPLMANFDTSISNDSFIRYVDNGTAFTVEWDKVALQEKSTEGEFTFQTTLHKNGDIVFVYRNVPPFIMNITDDHHPVKVGLSDAYIIDRTIFRK
jgi:phosphoribosylformylglycinamidine (FGAM) synthase-like amidotransferase family enzyme